MVGRRPLKGKGACGFCHMREQNPESGKLYKTPDDEVAAHLNCMLFSSTLVTPCSPDDDSFGGFSFADVKKEIKRGRRLKCSSCKQSGATIGCDVKKCKKSFHYLCAKKCLSELIEDEVKGIYKIYCVCHKDNRTSNGEEDNEDSNGENISTDDDQIKDIHDDASDDSTLDDDIESDLSSRHKKQPRNGVAKTSKRNMFKRAKTSTPHESSVKVTNEGSSSLDVSGNNTVPGPSSVLEANYKPEDGSTMVTGRTPITKRRRIIHDSDSSASSTPRSTPITVGIVHEGPKAESLTVEHIKPPWIKLLSGYRARVKEQRSIDGQNNTMRPRDFWQLCRVAKCTEALFEKIKASLESSMQRIQNQTASEDDYVQLFNVVRTTGCLQTIAGDLQREIKEQKEALEREKADLSQKELILNEIIPTLNISSTSEVSNEMAENVSFEFQ